MPASKYINDNYGHDAGDSLLIRIADALKQTDLSEESYRAAGDEFLVQGHTERDIDRAIEKAYNYLEQNPIQIVTADKTITIPARFSYGIAKDFKRADEKLQVHKAEREARGERSRRGEKPAGILETVPERIDTKDRRERIPETEVKPAEKTPEATPAKKSAEPATEPSEAVGSTISKKDEHPLRVFVCSARPGHGKRQGFKKILITDP